MTAAVKQLKQAIESLGAEARRHLSEAASEGRFDDLSELTPIVKDIAGLVRRWASEPEGIAVADGGQNTAGEKDAEAPADSHPNKAAAVVSQKLNRKDYPRFVREKNDLVKLGWSPREKGPYEHRAPKGVLEAVAAVVLAKGKTGHRFGMEDLLQSIARTKVGDNLPSYQVYAVVAWLKWSGMVLQHGRQGYTVVRPKTFSDSVQAAWQALPQR